MEKSDYMSKETERTKVELIVHQEMINATKEHSPFHTTHEGWAVMHEEIEELEKEFEYLKQNHDFLWDFIKNNDRNEQLYTADVIYKTSINLSLEAIQYAAMAKRYLIDFDKKEEDK